MTLIIASLALAAIYCGGVWAFTFVMFSLGRIPASADLEEHTFHLGLCFILSVGFLGLILNGG